MLLGENHSESHFNLALVYERRGLLDNAERETLVSLRLNPRQPDTRNLLGVIYAQEGKTARFAVDRARQSYALRWDVKEGIRENGTVVKSSQGQPTLADFLRPPCAVSCRRTRTKSPRRFPDIARVLFYRPP